MSKEQRGGNAPWNVQPSQPAKADSQGVPLPKEGASLAEVAQAIEDQGAICAAKKKEWERANFVTQSLAADLAAENLKLAQMRSHLHNLSSKAGS